MNQLKEHLIAGFHTAGYLTYTEAEIEERLAVVRSAQPRRPESFAFTVGRNWGIDRRKSAQAEANRRRAAQAKRRAATRYRHDLIDARREFWSIVAELRPELSAHQLGQCYVLYWKLLKGWNDDDVARVHPRTNRDTRNAWVSRARKLVWPHATANLRRFIERMKRSRQALHASI
jgi:hypothetical protein